MRASFADGLVQDAIKVTSDGLTILFSGKDDAHSSNATLIANK